MTVLFGDTNFTGYSVAGPSDADGGILAAAPFIATSAGLISSLYAYLQPAAPAQFVMALYDAQLQRLAYSAAITVSTAGLIRFPITPTPVALLQAYQIFLMPLAPAAFQYGMDASVFSNGYHVPGANLSPIPPFQLAASSPTAFGPPAFFADGDTQAQSILPSGKIGQTVLDTATVISLAFRRTKIRPNTISDEMLETARQELFLLLTSDLANRGTQLFAVDTQLLPMTAGLAGLATPAGTIDILNANYRYLQPFQQTALTTYAPVSATAITTLGLTWGGPAVPFLLQYSQDGANWITLKSATPNASAGQTSLYDLDGAIPALFWQVIADPTSPIGTFPLTLTQVSFYGTLSQTPMAPYSRDDFANLSNTFFTGRPFQFWLDRQDPWPIMRLWPTPQTNDQLNACIIIWRKRQIMDVGALSERLNVPNRWLTAIIDMLAARLGRSIIEVPPQMIPILDAQGDKSFNAVREEERENAPLRIQPGIYCYTR